MDWKNGKGSGKILWRLGNGGDFKVEAKDPNPWFSYAHDIGFEPAGSNMLEDAEVYGRNQVGRPYFARVLLDKGYVTNMQQAFDLYLADDAKAAVDRDELRSRIDTFIEIYMACPVEVLVERDVKGLYKKALSGEIPNFTGISDPYEPPPEPEVTIDSSKDSIEESVAAVLRSMEARGIITRQPDPVANGAAIAD